MTLTATQATTLNDLVFPVKTPAFARDVFISYSHQDRIWVDGILLPRLEAAGLSVCIDHRDFEGGLTSVQNIERAIETSRHTVVVLSPDWVRSQWTQFEGMLIRVNDLDGHQRRLIPVMLKDCVPSLSIRSLTYRDFREELRWENEWPLLMRDLGADSERSGEFCRKGFDALVELMQSPEVRVAVVASEGAFQSVSEQTTTLNAYKLLHDQFQELEKKFFMLEQLQKRLHKDPEAWDELDFNHEPEFQACASELVRTAEAAPFAAHEGVWCDTLKDVCKDLKSSTSNRSLELLTTVVEIVRKMLSRIPTRLNASLVATAQNLRLESLVRALQTVRDRIDVLPLADDNARSQRDDFRRGVDAVEDLRVNLTFMVQIHDLLQRIYDELYAVDALVLPDMQSVENKWRVERIMLQKLTQAGESQRLSALRAVAAQLDEAVLISRNLAQSRRLYHEYRRKALRDLNQADDELLALCKELRKVGESVAQILKEMQHGHR
jgi:hypothetical protein